MKKAFVTVCMVMMMMTTVGGAQERDVMDRYEERLLESGPIRYWSIEEQADFYKEITNGKEPAEITEPAIQSFLEHAHGIPDDTCISENEALLCAQKYLIENRYVSELDANHLVHYTYFYIDVIENPVYAFRFFRSNTGKELYSVWVNAKTCEIVEQNDGIADKKRIAEKYHESLCREKGAYRFWTLEEKARLAQLQIESGNLPEAFLDGTPSSEDISESEAVSLAQHALCNQTALDAESLNRFEVYVSFNTLHERAWHIAFHEMGSEIESYYVVVEAKNGTVLLVREGING